ncbi:TPA: hypothetical protein ACGO35_000200 [Streptococcus suis]
MHIEEILEPVRKVYPEIYQVIMAYLKGEIPEEEIDIFISLLEKKNRTERIKQQKQSTRT